MVCMYGFIQTCICDLIHSRLIVVVCCPLASHWYGGSCRPCSFLQHTNDPWWVAPSWTKTRGKPSKSGQEFPWQRSVDVYPPFPSTTCSIRLQTNNLEKHVTPSVSTNQTQPDPTPSTTLKTVEDPPHLDSNCFKKRRRSSQFDSSCLVNMEASMNDGTPKLAGWFVYVCFMENPKIRKKQSDEWMIAPWLLGTPWTPPLLGALDGFSLLSSPIQRQRCFEGSLWLPRSRWGCQAKPLRRTWRRLHLLPVLNQIPLGQHVGPQNDS